MLQAEVLFLDDDNLLKGRFMKIMACAVIIFSALLIQFSSLKAIAAESESAAVTEVNKPATLDEIIAYITVKWPEFVDSSVTYDAEGIKSSLQDTLNSVRFNRCDVVIERSLTSTYNGRNAGSINQKYSFDLKQIDRVSTGFYHDAKEGYTRNGVALFSVIFESTSGISKVISDKSINYSHASKETKVEFGVKTQEFVASMGSAFELAVQLCRGDKGVGK